MEAEPSLRHLAHLAALVLSPSYALESKGEVWGESEEGTAQGDSSSCFYFCTAIQRFVRQLDVTVGASGGMARFGMDDGYVLGPAEVVFRALEEFASDVQR